MEATTSNSAADWPLEISSAFGQNADAAHRILISLCNAPSRQWRAEELLEVSGVSSLVTGLMVLARLTYLGLITHPDLGVYQAGTYRNNRRTG